MERLRTEAACAPPQCPAQCSHSPKFKQGYAGILLYAHPENMDEILSAKMVYFFCEK